METLSMAVFGLHILFAVYDQQATIETADEVLIAPHVAEGLGMIGPSLRDQGPAEGTNIDGCSDYGWAPDYLLETLLVAFPRRLRRLCPGGMAATPRRLDHNSFIKELAPDAREMASDARAQLTAKESETSWPRPGKVTLFENPWQSVTDELRIGIEQFLCWLTRREAVTAIVDDNCTCAGRLQRLES
mmetsp:Transcript_53322/g.109180  ORF Transcript_53322/g.109180 Transcript_53322/m.109180 type:complete len:188 (-) Transcript_53322:262-825(-)